MTKNPATWVFEVSRICVTSSKRQNQNSKGADIWENFTQYDETLLVPGHVHDADCGAGFRITEKPSIGPTDVTVQRTARRNGLADNRRIWAAARRQRRHR